MTDDRENLPSISRFEAMSLCAARFQMEQQVAEPPASPEAKYGTEVHGSLETGESEDLTQEQRELAEEMREQEQALVKEVFGKQIIAEFYREKRFWYVHKGWVKSNEIISPGAIQDCGPEKLFSGKLDFATWAHSDERVSLYIDYKALWGDTTPPARNMQLRGGAVLMKQNFGSRRAFVAIVQPTKRKYAIAAEYGPEELERAEQECVQLVERAQDRVPQATPGPEQCKYCRAKLICNVAYGKSIQQLSQGPTKKYLEFDIRDVTDEFLDDAGQRWEVAQIIGKAIDAEIKRRKLADPESMPNYAWKDSGHTSEIAAPGLVWPKFSHLLTAEEFSDICKVSKTALEETVHKKTGMTLKDSKKTVEKLLGILLVRKPKKPSLQRRPYYEIKP